MIIDRSVILNGISEAKGGNTLRGYKLLEKVMTTSPLPEVKAWFGYCLASESRNFPKGQRLCKDALEQDPDNSDLYLALGRLYLDAGRRKEAIYTLHAGLNKERNMEIHRLLQCIGARKPPIFRFLSRQHRVNVGSGRLLTKIGLR